MRNPHPPSLVAGQLAITFAWAVDRWAHRVTIAGRLIAESVEGAGTDGDPRWPASPPLVELTPTTTAGRPAVVGVGLAGRSHFSASLVPLADRPDTVLVEIACRLQEEPAWLGSTYRLAGGGRLRITAAGRETALPRTVQWSYTVGPTGIVAGGDAACDRPPDRSHS